MPSNYGDVALGLPADWDRNKYQAKRFLLLTVGHSNGKADAFLTKEPEAKHNFRWVDPANQQDIDDNRTNGFDFVQKDTWSKNELLWRWDAQGFVEAYGNRLMARPAALWEAEEARRNAEVARVQKAAERHDIKSRRGDVSEDAYETPARRARG